MKKNSRAVRYNKWGYIFLMPFILVYVVFQFIPMATTIYNSFFENYRSGLTQIGPNYIGLENFDNDCSISDRLIIWIANIVRWIKYIIPVAVMVLGILDFIKAISAGKDDEMKKAQGNFIKRLIAAALIFIIPLIIEFVLDKMGYASNGCGIIDL